MQKNLRKIHLEILSKCKKKPKAAWQLSYKYTNLHSTCTRMLKRVLAFRAHSCMWCLLIYIHVSYVVQNKDAYTCCTVYLLKKKQQQVSRFRSCIATKLPVWPIIGMLVKCCSCIATKRHILVALYTCWNGWLADAGWHSCSYGP